MLPRRRHAEKRERSVKFALVDSSRPVLVPLDEEIFDAGPGGLQRVADLVDYERVGGTFASDDVDADHVVQSFCRLWRVLPNRVLDRGG